jgi:hypothetical protein
MLVKWCLNIKQPSLDGKNKYDIVKNLFDVPTILKRWTYISDLSVCLSFVLYDVRIVLLTERGEEFGFDQIFKVFDRLVSFQPRF